MHKVGTEKVALHFIDCIIQDEQKADANVVLTCLEAAMHALQCRCPRMSKVIVQSDDATNLASRQSCSYLMCALLLG